MRLWLIIGVEVGIVFGSLDFGIPCEPPSDEAKPGEVERALFERVARVAQRPVWLRNAGEFGEPGCCRDTVSEAWGAGAAALAPRFTVFLASACAPSRSTLRESESGALFLGDFLLATQKKVTSCRAAPGNRPKGQSSTLTLKSTPEPKVRLLL
jgi:hypothetical protein